MKNKPMKLYTKTGDGGESGLADGSRLSKGDLVFELLGSLDEINAAIGFCVSELNRNDRIVKKEHKKIASELLVIQDRLLVVGAVVAGSKKVQVSSADLGWLEDKIDYYQVKMSDDWTVRFLLPGGIELAARIDLARVGTRRVERVFVEFRIQNSGVRGQSKIDSIASLQNDETIVLVGKYLNRLSDYLFALRCYVNYLEGYEEIKFQGGYGEKVFGIKGDRKI